MKLIKTQDKFILVSDESIKEGDYFLSGKLIHKAEEILDCDNDNELEIHSEGYCNPYSLCKKIIAGIPETKSINFNGFEEELSNITTANVEVILGNNVYLITKIIKDENL